MQRVKKTWTYQQVTESAEKQIALLREQLNGSSENNVRALNNLAYGVFLGWSALTSECQNPGDRNRMQALANSVKIEENLG